MMITNQEIVETYLTYKGKKLTNSGKKDYVYPLMPFFIMDSLYQIYCKDIKDIDCKFGSKKAKTKWKTEYNEFNKEFFRAFSEDQIDYIVEKMDEFNDYIHNYIVMLKSAVMASFVKEASFEDRKILSAVFTCNVLSQAAQHLHKAIYQKFDIGGRLVGESNKHIEGVRKAIVDFASHYPSAKGVDLSSSSNVMSMVNVICTQIMNFLKSKNNESNA